MSLAVSDAVSQTLYAAMNGLTEQQNVAADDIANVDTPNYRASTVNFEDSLREAVNDGSIANGTDGVQIQKTATDLPVGSNGNNVDLRKEEMTAIQSLYQYKLVSQAYTDHNKLITAVTAQ